MHIYYSVSLNKKVFYIKNDMLIWCERKLFLKLYFNMLRANARIIGFSHRVSSSYLIPILMLGKVTTIRSLQFYDWFFYITFQQRTRWLNSLSWILSCKLLISYYCGLCLPCVLSQCLYCRLSVQNLAAQCCKGISC